MKPFFDDCPCCQAMARDGFAGIPETDDEVVGLLSPYDTPLTPETLFAPRERPLEVVPDTTGIHPLDLYAEVDPILVGVLAHDEDLRVANLAVSLNVLRRARGFSWEVLLVLARGRGAWVVGWDPDDAVLAAREAVEQRGAVVAALCELLGWSPSQIPLGAVGLVVDGEPPPDGAGPLAASELIGRSALPRLAERLRAVPVCLDERNGAPVEAERVEQFFAALCAVGALLPVLQGDAPIELPAWMLPRQ